MRCDTHDTREQLKYNCANRVLITCNALPPPPLPPPHITTPHYHTHTPHPHHYPPTCKRSTKQRVCSITTRGCPARNDGGVEETRGEGGRGLGQEGAAEEEASPVYFVVPCAHVLPSPPFFSPIEGGLGDRPELTACATRASQWKKTSLVVSRTLPPFSPSSPPPPPHSLPSTPHSRSPFPLPPYLRTHSYGSTCPPRPLNQ